MRACILVPSIPKQQHRELVKRTFLGQVVPLAPLYWVFFGRAIQIEKTRTDTKMPSASTGAAGDAGNRAKEPPTTTGMVDAPPMGGSWSALLLALVSLAIYLFVLRPTTAASRERRHRQAAGRVNHNSNTPAQPVGGANRRRPAAPAAAPMMRVGVGAGGGDGGGGGRATPTPARRAIQLSEAAVEILSECQGQPPHLGKQQKATDNTGNQRTTTTTTTTTMKIGGTPYLVDGIVGFGNTTAAAVARQLPSERSLQLRQDRAKIFSRWLAAPRSQTASTGSTSSISNNEEINETATTTTTVALTPPTPKSIVVVGLSHQKLMEDAKHASAVADVLVRLATYYTLLLMVQHVDSNNGHSKKEDGATLHEQIVQTLRLEIGNHENQNDDESLKLTEAVLPSHRIMMCGSTTGRVALVRQLGTVGLVVDFDFEVKKELERFGYPVVVVPLNDWVPTAAALTTSS